jgi:putative heme-binding domain-containing protein
MPHLGSNVTDDRGVKLIGDWIASLGSSSPDAVPATPQAAQELLASTSGALKLVRAMERDALPAPVRAHVVVKGINSPQLAVHDLFVRFDPTHQNADRLGTTFDRAKLLARPGSADAGRKIFFELNGTGLCARCHLINGKGADYGPDLSHIATKYNPLDLLDNIVEPSKTIDPKFVNYLAQTTDGEVHQGLLISRTNDQIVLKDPELKETRLPAAEVKRLVPQKISAMPEGLLSELVPQRAADLLAFLRTLR